MGVKGLLHNKAASSGMKATKHKAPFILLRKQAHRTVTGECFAEDCIVAQSSTAQGQN